MPRVYLDNATMIRPESYEAVEEALRTLYDIFGASPSDGLILASSAEDAQSQVFFSHYLDVVRETGRNHFFVIDATEKRLEALGCLFKPIARNEKGHVDLAALRAQMGPRTSLLSLPWGCSRTGIIQPLEEIGALCREKGVRLHIDATDVFGKLFFRFQDLPVDTLSFEAGIFVKRARREWNDTNTPIPLATKAKALHDHFDFFSTETARLRDKLEAAFPNATIIGKDVERLPNISAMLFPGLCGEALLFLLYRKGIYAAQQGEALSFTLSYSTTEEEIDYVIDTLSTAVKDLQGRAVC